MGMQTTVLIASAGVLLFVVMVILGGHRLFTERRRAAQERLISYLDNRREDQDPVSLRRGIFRERTLSGIPTLDAVLKGKNFAEQIALELAQAHVHLRVGEYLFVRLMLAGAGFLVALAVSGRLLVGLMFGIVGFLAPKLYVVYRRRRRLKEFEGQLVDVLDLIANSLKAGHSLLQAMDQASSQLAPPVSEELGQLLREVSIGSTVEDAIANLVARMESYDLRLIATAIVTQRSVGGNLAEVLETIAHTIRERVRVLGQVRILTAEARLSGWVLGLLPVILALVFYVVHPDYMDVLFTTTEGKFALAAAAGLEIIGFFALRRLAVVDV